MEGRGLCGEVQGRAEEPEPGRGQERAERLREENDGVEYGLAELHGNVKTG